MRNRTTLVCADAGRNLRNQRCIEIQCKVKYPQATKQMTCGYFVYSVPVVPLGVHFVSLWDGGVCRPQAANQVQSIFCRGVYLAKNTSQSASVEFVRFQRTNYARGRLQAFCPKRARPFLDKINNRHCVVFSNSIAPFVWGVHRKASIFPTN